MIIGVDPQKASHTATAVDAATNAAVSSLRVDATIGGYRQLFALGQVGNFTDRRVRNLNESSTPIDDSSELPCLDR